MAADQQMTASDGQRLFHKKVRRARYDGSDVLMATCGDAEASVAFYLWLEEQEKWRSGLPPEGEHKDIHYPSKADFHALVMFSNGDVLWFGPTGYPVEIRERWHGIGSGSSYALGALHAGADIKKALQIAIKMDSQSGLGVQVEGFTTTTKKRKRK